MKIKKVVGVVVYNDDNKVFMMTSPKWKKYVIPGGKIEEGETGEVALRREIREELGIEITDIVYVNEVEKPPSDDFYDEGMAFVFVDYFARALSTTITPNPEISAYDWYHIDAALALPLMDETRALLERFKEGL